MAEHTLSRFLPAVTEVWLRMHTCTDRLTDRHTKLVNRFTTGIGPVLNNNNNSESGIDNQKEPNTKCIIHIIIYMKNTLSIL